jgi:hypothetical protein
MGARFRRKAGHDAGRQTRRDHYRTLGENLNAAIKEFARLTRCEGASGCRKALLVNVKIRVASDLEYFRDLLAA